MPTVSLDPYRTEGTTVYAGFDRGKAVAEEIEDTYGRKVEIEVPEDVHHIGSHFRAGFHSVLPHVIIPSTSPL